MADRLQNKVVLVTGGTSGIGRTTALLAASEGAQVMVAGRRPAEGDETVALIEQAGGTAAFVRCDISNPEEVRVMVEKTIARFGRLDGVVNNASIEGPVQNIFDLSPEDWDQVIRINLSGTFYCLKYQGAAMKENGGSIVCIGSINSMIGCGGVAAYVASKHGLLGLVRSASAEFGDYGIRVNTVCPGIILTPMHSRLKGGIGADAYAAFFQNRTHMKRAGTPDEVAAPILWLLSDEASYMTGTELVMDGGSLAT